MVGADLELRADGDAVDAVVARGVRDGVQRVTEDVEVLAHEGLHLVLEQEVARLLRVDLHRLPRLERGRDHHGVARRLVDVRREEGPRLVRDLEALAVGDRDGPRGVRTARRDDEGHGLGFVRQREAVVADDHDDRVAERTRRPRRGRGPLAEELPVGVERRGALRDVDRLHRSRRPLHGDGPLDASRRPRVLGQALRVEHGLHARPGDRNALDVTAHGLLDALDAAGGTAALPDDDAAGAPCVSPE